MRGRAWKLKMKIAALTYVYNENVNLPIWRRYYGANFGEENLFVVDRESDDGSTVDLGAANRIRVPRVAFDDWKKVAMINALHTALLQSFDCVLVTDCDEFVIPDPEKYSGLRSYIETNKPKVMYCIGLNVRHIITHEAPLDLTKPILGQRRFANFHIRASKPAISSVPTRWSPGNHICDQDIALDKELYLFHLKFMDYSLAMRRQQTNRDTVWSVDSLEARHGAHHRYEYEQFVAEGFLDPVNIIRGGNVTPFVFDAEVKAMVEGKCEKNGVFWPGDAKQKYVEIPERFYGVV